MRPTAPPASSFDQTQEIQLASAKSYILHWLEGGPSKAHVDLVWHNPSQDKRALAILGIHVDEYVYTTSCFDTGELYQSKYGLPHPPQLEKVLRTLGIPVTAGALHNAGNDAAYTLMAFNQLHTATPFKIPTNLKKGPSSARLNTAYEAKHCGQVGNRYATGGIKNVRQRTGEDCVREAEADWTRSTNVLLAGGVLMASYFAFKVAARDPGLVLY